MRKLLKKCWVVYLVPVIFMGVAVYMGITHFRYHSDGHSLAETFETVQLVFCGFMSGLFMGIARTRKNF